jgi:hypothetical protein
MPDRSRIPRKIAELNAYINNSTRYLLKDSPPAPYCLPNQVPVIRENWERLGVLPAQMKIFDTLVAQWRVPYKLYSSPAAYSPAVESELLEIQIKLTELMEQFPQDAVLAALGMNGK